MLSMRSSTQCWRPPSPFSPPFHPPTAATIMTVSADGFTVTSVRISLGTTRQASTTSRCIFVSTYLAQPSYMTRSGRRAGDFKTACAHGRIKSCNTTFYRIALLGLFFLPSCALVLRALEVQQVSFFLHTIRPLRHPQSRLQGSW